MRGFLRERVYRHYKVNRMALKARRVVRELLEVLLDAPDCLPDGWRERAGEPGSAGDGGGRARLHRRDDRPVRARRARPPVQAEPGARVNPFADLLDLVNGALDRLERDGALPTGLDRARVTAEPPRDPAHGEAATNAALILAKGAGKKPLELAQAIAAALEGAPEVAGVAVAPPGFVNLTHDPRLLAARRARDPAGRTGVRPQPGRRRRHGQRRVQLRQPDGPAACRPRARHGVRRRARQPAGVRGIPRDSRILRKRRRGADRDPGPLDPPPLPRGAGRGRRAGARGLLPRRLPRPRRAADRRGRRQALAGRARGRVAGPTSPGSASRPCCC